MNQAEVIHSSWVKCYDMNLSLLRAAMADVKDNKLLLAKMDLYLNRGCKEGTGPSVVDLDA